MFGNLVINSVVDPSSRVLNRKTLHNCLDSIKSKTKENNFDEYYSNCKVNASVINTSLRVEYNCSLLDKYKWECATEETDDLERFLRLVAEYAGMHFYHHDDQFLTSSEIIIIEIFQTNRNVVIQFANSIKFDQRMETVLTKLLIEYPNIFKDAVTYLVHLESQNELQKWSELILEWKETPILTKWIGPSLDFTFDYFGYQNGNCIQLSDFVFVNREFTDSLSLNKGNAELKLSDYHLFEILWSYFKKTSSDFPKLNSVCGSIQFESLTSEAEVDHLIKFTVTENFNYEAFATSLSPFFNLKYFIENFFVENNQDSTRVIKMDINSDFSLTFKGEKSTTVAFTPTLTVNRQKITKSSNFISICEKHIK
eukprot:NODE_241_length_11910_cov_1.082381.p3 type:complete len:368 gc:universal NODE_241_length_11910_cov_1.082381:2502-3605(+)